MATMTQVEFARHIDRDKSHITRLKQAGRLVMTADGLVEVEASVARIAATRGQRYDVEARFADQRGADPVESAATTEATDLQPLASAADAPDDGLDIDAIGRRTRYAQMLTAEAQARVKEREDLQAAGELIPRAAVAADMATAVGEILNALEGLPDRVAPLVVGVSDQPTVRAMLRDEIERTMAAVSAQLGRVAMARVPT